MLFKKISETLYCSVLFLYPRTQIYWSAREVFSALGISHMYVMKIVYRYRENDSL